MRLIFSGRHYETCCYGVNPVTGWIDMGAVRAKAKEFRPRVLIAGWSAYPRTLDFAAFRDIADEVVHTCGWTWRTSPVLSRGPKPVTGPDADLVSTTVHKTLGGARSGLILGKQQFAKAVNSAVFPARRAVPPYTPNLISGNV